MFDDRRNLSGDRSKADDKLLIYFDDEEHIVRRLGAAVVSCWAELPEEVRAKLIGRSDQVFDEHESDRFDEQVKNFIAEHSRKR